MKHGTWHRVRLVVVLMGVLLVARFAIPTAIRATREAISSRQSAAAERRLRRPAPPLPIRPGDYARFPRQGFGFDWSNDVGWRLDTFHGTLTKDLVSDPDTTVAFVLTPAELDSIYERMIEIRLFDFPEPRPPAWGGKPRIFPCREYHMLLRAGSVKRELVWYSGERLPDDDQKRFIGLFKLIMRVVESHAEYRALPAARGAYL